MANNLTVEISMTSAGTVANLEKIASDIPVEVKGMLNESAELAKHIIESRAPVGLSGGIGQGISNNVSIYPLGMSVMVKPNDNVPYADAVETGSRPHMPPVDALQAWADMHGIDVWALAKSILRDGTKPHPFIKPSYEEVKSPISQIFARGIQSYLALEKL